VSQDQFISDNEMNVIHSTYEAVLTAYTSRIDSLAEEAFPVIENVYRTNTQGYQNIVIPFNNGLKGIQIAVNLEKAHSSGGKEMISALEKGITLAIIDQNWKEHLRAMDDLRSNVQFAAHEQKDPLLIYKKESFDLFRTMITKTNAEIANFLLTCQLPSGPQVNQAPQREVVRTQTVKADSGNLNQQASQAQEAGEMVSQQRSAPVVADPKINRNEPCPCGSGKKYKSCHGK
jgi:preprotein translocase subunit SecA